MWIVAEGMVEKLRRTSLLDQDLVKLELRIEVDDVAETVGRLAQKGANPVATAANQKPDIGQTAVFEDPDGNLNSHSSKTQLIGVDETLPRITKRLGLTVRCTMSANGLASGR